MQQIHQRVIVNIFTIHILMCQILKCDIEILSCFESSCGTNDFNILMPPLFQDAIVKLDESGGDM